MHFDNIGFLPLPPSLLLLSYWNDRTELELKKDKTDGTVIKPIIDGNDDCPR